MFKHESNGYRFKTAMNFVELFICNIFKQIVGPGFLRPSAIVLLKTVHFIIPFQLQNLIKFIRNVFMYL